MKAKLIKTDKGNHILIDPNKWTALDFLGWMKLNGYKIIKNDKQFRNY
jgi:prophage maintenance system killer protein